MLELTGGFAGDDRGIIPKLEIGSYFQFHIGNISNLFSGNSSTLLFVQKITENFTNFLK